MNNSLKKLESQLESMTPRGISDEGRERCHEVIEDLLNERFGDTEESRKSSWHGSAAAAAIALSIGVGGGWYFGNENERSSLAEGDQDTSGQDSLSGEVIEREAWVLADGSPDVYLTKDGEIWEISREVEITKEVIQHRESGVEVTVETTDHHVVDTPKSEF